MASSDAYMELSDPNVWGETYDSYFGMSGRALGAFEISKFSFDIASKSDDTTDPTGKKTPANTPSTTMGRTTAAIAEPTIKTFSISKFIDKASPDLFLACCKKTLIQWCIISIRETGELTTDKGVRKPYLVIEFQNLHVASFKWDMSPGDSEEAPSQETIDFDFETILIKYSRQDRTGEHVPVKIKGWNRPLHNENVAQLQTEQQGTAAN